MNWDDYRVFLAVARRKKLALAARDLKLDETTISRRLKQLENRLGQTLFERLRTGHALTIYGESLLIKAEEIDHHASTISEAPRGRLQKPGGTLRISVAEGFGAHILSPILSDFCTVYPEIEIDLVSGSGFLSLSRREADISIGLRRSKSRQIISEKLSPYDLYLYASQAYLSSRSSITSLSDLSAHVLIDYVDDLIYSDELRFFQDALPNLLPSIRSTSILAQNQLVEAGAGLAILPKFLASADLQPILKETIHIKREFWYSCHQSIAPLAKAKAFKAFAFTALKDNLSRKQL